MKKSKSKQAIILVILFVLAGVALAWYAPQWRAARAAQTVQAKAGEYVQFADVEQITITDEHIIIPAELEGNPQTQAFVANAIAQRNIVEVANTAITSMEHVGIQNGWADAVGSLADNMWIVMICVIGLVWLKAKGKQEKGGQG